MSQINPGLSHLAGNLSPSQGPTGVNRELVQQTLVPFRDLGKQLVPFADRLVDMMDIRAESPATEALKNLSIGVPPSAPGGLAIQEPFPEEVSNTTQLSRLEMLESFKNLDLKMTALSDKARDLVANEDVTLKLRNSGQLIHGIRADLEAINSSITTNIRDDDD